MCYNRGALCNTRYVLCTLIHHSRAAIAYHLLSNRPISRKESRVQFWRKQIQSVNSVVNNVTIFAMLQRQTFTTHLLPISTHQGQAHWYQSSNIHVSFKYQSHLDFQKCLCAVLHGPFLCPQGHPVELTT